MGNSEGYLTLPLLMLGVLTDHANDTATMDHFALVTNLFYGCPNLHYFSSFLCVRCTGSIQPGDLLLVAVHNPTAGEVIRTQLDGNPVAWKDADKILPHAA